MQWNRFTMLNGFLLLRYSALLVIAIIILWNLSSTLIPGFFSPSTTHINLNGTDKSFQNLPIASGILSVWGKFVSSTWTSAFCYDSLAFSDGSSSHHGDSHSEQPHYWCWKSEKKAGLLAGTKRDSGEKRALPFLKGCIFSIGFYNFLETISFTKNKCFQISKTKCP